MDSRGGLTPGDPLGDPDAEAPARVAPDAPARVAPDAPPRPSSGYSGGNTPPGAFAPRRREDLARPTAEPAEYWRRAVAAIVDAIIVGIAATLIFVVALAPLDIGDSTGGVIGAIIWALVLTVGLAIAAFLYAPLVMARTNGKTVGKMLTGCRVVRADGRRIDFLWAVMREVVVKSILGGIAASVTAGISFLVNYLWPLWDRKNRAIHDIIVDSRVVRD